VIELKEVDGSAAASKITVGQIGKTPSPHNAAYAYDLIGTKESALDQRRDVDVEVDGGRAMDLGQQHLGLYSLLQFSQYYLIFDYVEVQPKTHNTWAPSKGVGICDGTNSSLHNKQNPDTTPSLSVFDENIDDEDVGNEELDELFGGSSDDWMSEEFEQIPDDDEDDNESETTSTTKKSEKTSKRIKQYTTLPAWLSQDYADT